MDLGAYVNIENLDEIAKKNGIDVPRLRGYRLMSQEQPLSDDELRELIESARREVYRDAVDSWPRFRPNSYECGPVATDRFRKKYLIVEKEVRKRFDGSEYERENVVGFRWDLVHGKNRKAIKFAIKQREKAVRAQYALWNKYAGKEGVLYIHARIGGGNWSYFGGDRMVASQPWFLGRVDDCWDYTYCDIYAKIK